jgi:hypothetical protein
MNFNELHNISSSILHEGADVISVDGETYYYYEIGVPFIICKGPGLPFLFFIDKPMEHLGLVDDYVFTNRSNKVTCIDHEGVGRLTGDQIKTIKSHGEKNLLFGRLWNIKGKGYLSFWEPSEEIAPYIDLVIEFIEEMGFTADNCKWDFVSLDEYLGHESSEEERKVLANKRALHIQAGMKRALGKTYSGGSSKQGDIAHKTGKDFYAKYKKFVDPYGLKESLITEDPDAIVIDSHPDVLRLGFTEYNAHSFIGVEKNGSKVIIYNIKNSDTRNSHTELLGQVARICYLFKKYKDGSLYELKDRLKKEDIGVVFEDDTSDIGAEQLYRLLTKYRNTRNIKEIFGRIWKMPNETYGAVWNPKRFARYYNVIIKMLEEMNIDPENCVWEVKQGSVSKKIPSEFVKTSDYLKLSSKTSIEHQRELDAKRALHLQPGMKRALGSIGSSGVGSSKQEEIAKIAGFPTFSAYKQSFIKSESHEKTI